MKKIVFIFLSVLFVCLPVIAQTAGTVPAATQAASDEKPKRQIFRPTKDQIKQVQTMLKSKSLYTGEATGKFDDATRASIKSWQKDNGLKETGTLNRATLEKMGIELTETQKKIPVSESSYATADKEQKTKTKAVKSEMPAGTTTSADAKSKKVIFRATKDQIMAAQKMLKSKGMYSGEENGKLDDATRSGLKKYQDETGLKATGTLNQATLEKMGIDLTDKQKADAAEANK